MFGSKVHFIIKRDNFEELEGHFKKKGIILIKRYPLVKP